MRWDSSMRRSCFLSSPSPSLFPFPFVFVCVSFVVVLSLNGIGIMRRGGFAQLVYQRFKTFFVFLQGGTTIPISRNERSISRHTVTAPHIMCDIGPTNVLGTTRITSSYLADARGISNCSLNEGSTTASKTPLSSLRSRTNTNTCFTIDQGCLLRLSCSLVHTTRES